MIQKPLVTIICLCYNHSKFVIESLQSVLNQSYKPIQVIVVDDCSCDNSVSVIKKWLNDYPEILFISNEKNLGNTKSFNNAAQFAKGEYLIDLAADDLLMSDCLKNQVEKFEKSEFKNLAIVYGNCELISENGLHDSYYFEVDVFERVIEKRITGNIYSAVISTGNSYCSVSGMIKRSVFNSLKGYDESLAYEDLDFWIRASRDYEIDFVDAVLVQKRVLQNSLEKQFLKPNNKINYSTNVILNKALKLNRTKEEDLSLLKRVHYEIVHSYKNKNLLLLIKNLILKIKLSCVSFLRD